MLTESYSSIPDSPEPSTPLDQIRNFPHRIEHAIEWARENFLELFVESPKQANDYMRDPQSFAQRISEVNSESYENRRITEIQSLVGHSRPRTFADCIQWVSDVFLTLSTNSSSCCSMELMRGLFFMALKARNDFDEKFNYTIARLLKHFPPDFIASNGTRFWIEHKLCPHALQFDSSHPTHRDFIIAASSLMASVYHIPVSLDQFQSIQFDTKADSISSDLETTKDSASKAEEILARLPVSDVWLNLKLRAHEMKLDDESNCQLDYLVAATCLRAENYGIEMVERSEVKPIAAKIVPAIVTTAALLAGFMTLEMCKVIQGHRNIEYFKESFLNTALPMFMFCELMPAKRQTVS